MRRVVAVLALVVAVGGGCSNGGDGEQSTGAASTAPPPTLETSSTTAPTARVDAECPGPGAVPSRGEITWVSDGRLLAADPDGSGAPRCLVDLSAARDVAPVSWGAKGDRVLFGQAQAVLPSGVHATGLVTSQGASWSRPSGKAYLAVDPFTHHLLRQPVGGGPAEDITFLDSHQSAVYHPAGRNVVSVGTKDGTYGIWVATNRGSEVKALARAEEAVEITDLTWTASGALLFVARHADGETHLHRLVLGDDEVTTVASAHDFTGLSASPFEGGGVAWSQDQDDPCDPGKLFVTRGAHFLHLDGTPAERATPVGWLPDGKLVVRTGPLDPSTCGADEPNRLLVLSADDGTITPVGPVLERFDAAAVRAALPPPPEMPSSIPDDAPA